MKKVWIVLANDYHHPYSEDPADEITKVFDTEQKATDFIAAQPPRQKGSALSYWYISYEVE